MIRQFILNILESIGFAQKPDNHKLSKKAKKVYHFVKTQKKLISKVAEAD